MIIEFIFGISVRMKPEINCKYPDLREKSGTL